MPTTDPEQNNAFEDATDTQNTPDTPETLPHSSGLTVIGIGASAGGLLALQHFFQALPPDTGMAFVVVLHLSPEHESVLAELLQSHTLMPAQQVTERIEMQPNHVYVIPPGKRLVVSGDSLDLAELEMVRGRRLQIDTFFQSLAAHQGDGAAIILSGSGSDGAVGIQSIKKKNGLILVQSPDEAEFDGMPNSAIATGLVDIIAPVAELAAHLVAAKRTHAALQLPTDAQGLSEAEQQILRQILAHLRVRTGQDFGGYKRTTLLRRLGRRMQLAQVETLSAYLNQLRQGSEEAEALYRDLLIHVTEFFRDAHAWETLAQTVIPRIFEGKGRDDFIRVWSVGCATGEEVYTLAMLLLEHAATLPEPPQIQLFASDLGKVALDFARDGIYPEAIAANVSEERLDRFFVKDNSHYRVRPEVRERILFTAHNLLQDPPFSRLDLISCRNLLIYLQRDVQERVLELFQYALLPSGYLFLGSAESSEGVSTLFETVDKRSRIYQRSQESRNTLILPTPPLLPSPQRRNVVNEGQGEDKGSVDVEHSTLLEEVGPPSLLVDEGYHVLHLSETAGRYLQPPGGPLTQDVLRLVRPELQAGLRSALFRVLEGGSQSVLTPPVPVRFNGAPHPVSLLVRTSPGASERRRVVVFFLENETPTTEADADQEESGQRARVGEMEMELRHTQRMLQTKSEEYETTVEELRAANEELQSTNEEYHSTLEELETSKEELQSVNEELQTVNHELQNKVEQVSQSNSDLQNLMVATEIATLFLDLKLRIKRYTPNLSELFNLMPTDQGRPIGHLRSRLKYQGLEQDAHTVATNLATIQHEVQSDDGRWFMVNLRPYRAVENKIDGVVITFVDITANKETELALAKAKVYAESIVHTIPDALLVLETDLRVRTANDTFYQMFEVDPQETEGELIYNLGNGQWNIPELHTLLEEILPENNIFIGYEVEHEFESIGRRTMLLNGRRLDHVQFILLVITDITQRKQAEEALRQSEASQAFLVRLNDTLRPLTDPIEIQAEAARILGEYMEIDRAYYVEIDEASGDYVVAQDWRRPGAPSHARRYPLEDWPMPWLVDGKTWVVRDVDSDPALPDDQRESYRGNDIGAAIVVPLLKNGHLVATLVANQRAPRTWTADEQALVEETAQRTWAAVERARAEARRIQAEERYLGLFNAIDQGFCTIEVAFAEDEKPIDYRFLEISPSFERQTGIANADGRWMREIAEDQDEHWFETYGRVARTGEPVRFESYSTPLERWWTVYAFRTGEPEERQIAVLFRDITGRKQAEELLRQTQESLEVALEAAEMGTWDFDLTTNQTRTNLRHNQIFGHTEPVDGWNPALFLKQSALPEDQPTFQAAYEKALETGELNVEVRIRRPDGAVRWVRNQGRVYYDKEGKPARIAGVTMDVTGQKEAQVSEMHQRILQAQELERTQLAHEIHDGPMQELAALSFEIVTLVSELEEESLQVRLVVINAKLERNIRLLRHLMTTLRPPAVVNFGLEMAIQSHIEDFRQQQPAIDIELVISEGIPTLSEEVILAVYRICQQAIYNIVQHAQADQVWVRFHSQDNLLSLEVEDNGIGFTMPENLVDLPRRKHLGVVGMTERARAIGGELTVDSAPGQGTRVRVVVPF